MVGAPAAVSTAEALGRDSGSYDWRWGTLKDESLSLELRQDGPVEESCAAGICELLRSAVELVPQRSKPSNQPSQPLQQDSPF